MFKNGKFVKIPNTNSWGLDLAALLGILGGSKDYGLMVLNEIDEETIDEAQQMIKDDKIEVEYVEGVPDVFVNMIITTSNEQIEVILKDSHDHIEEIKVNREVVFQNKMEEDGKKACDF